MDMFAWNAVLTIIIGLVGWAVKIKDKELDEMKQEQQRVQILLNRTREEMAREYVTKAEVHADINRVLDRLERLDEKLDRMLDGRRNDSIHPR